MEWQRTPLTTMRSQTDMKMLSIPSKYRTRKVEPTGKKLEQLLSQCDRLDEACLSPIRKTEKGDRFDMRKATMSSSQSQSSAFRAETKQIIWNEQPSVEQSPLIITIQNFFRDFLASNQGCDCESPCQVAEKLTAWIEGDNSQLMRLKYKGLVEIMERTCNKNGQWQEIKQQIQRDIPRTQPQHQVFRTAEFMGKEERIMLCYALEDPGVYYVQGMNMILSGLLYHIRDEAIAYFVFKKVLSGVRTIYLHNFQECHGHIRQLASNVKRYARDLHEHLELLEVDLNICVSWVLSLLASIVPLTHLHHVYLGFIEEGWMYIHKVMLALMVYHCQAILSMREESQVLVLLTHSNHQRATFDWEAIFAFAIRLNI